eukprot:COSAG03_NODE_1968_length_3280_cov_21.156869_3_plen_172_part_00
MSIAAGAALLPIPSAATEMAETVEEKAGRVARIAAKQTLSMVRSPKLTVAFSQSSYTLMTYRVVGPGGGELERVCRHRQSPGRLRRRGADRRVSSAGERGCVFWQSEEDAREPSAVRHGNAGGCAGSQADRPCASEAVGITPPLPPSPPPPLSLRNISRTTNANEYLKSIF